MADVFPVCKAGILQSVLSSLSGEKKKSLLEVGFEWERPGDEEILLVHMCFPEVQCVHIFVIENGNDRQHTGKIMSIPHSNGLIAKSTAGRE